LYRNKHIPCTTTSTFLASQQAPSLYRNKAPFLHHNKHLPCIATSTFLVPQQAHFLHHNEHIPCIATSTFLAPQQAHSLHHNKHLFCTRTLTQVRYLRDMGSLSLIIWDMASRQQVGQCVVSAGCGEWCVAQSTGLHGLWFMAAMVSKV
jgi:hypothetical protein